MSPRARDSRSASPRWSDACAGDAGHGRGGARRLGDDGVQRVQPAGEALARAARADPGQGRRARLRGARTCSRARCGAARPACSASCWARRCRTRSRTPRRSSGCAGSRAPGIALHLVPATGGEGDAALVLDAAVDAFVLYSLPDGHPLVEAVLRRRVPVVVQSGPQLDGLPVRGDRRARGRRGGGGAPALARPHAAGGAEPAVLARRPRRPAVARRAPAAPRHPRAARGLRRRRRARGAAQRPRARRGRRGRAARRPRAAHRPAVHERRAGHRRAACGRGARVVGAGASCRWSAGTTRARASGPG